MKDIDRPINRIMQRQFANVFERALDIAMLNPEIEEKIIKAVSKSLEEHNKTAAGGWNSWFNV